MPMLHQMGLQYARRLDVPSHHHAAADTPVTADLRVFLLETLGQTLRGGDIVKVAQIILQGFKALQVDLQPLPLIEVLEELHGIAQFLQRLANLVTLFRSEGLEMSSTF